MFTKCGMLIKGKCGILREFVNPARKLGGNLKCTQGLCYKIYRSHGIILER